MASSGQPSDGSAPSKEAQDALFCYTDETWVLRSDLEQKMAYMGQFAILERGGEWGDVEASQHQLDNGFGTVEHGLILRFDALKDEPDVAYTEYQVIVSQRPSGVHVVSNRLTLDGLNRASRATSILSVEQEELAWVTPDSAFVHPPDGDRVCVTDTLPLATYPGEGLADLPSGLITTMRTYIHQWQFTLDGLTSDTQVFPPN